MHIFDEVHNVEGAFELEESEAPDCVAAVIAAGDELVLVEGVDAQAVDALHVIG